MSEELGVRESAVLFDLRPGQWLWLDKPYDEASEAPVVLGPLHVGDGKQWVYWEVWKNRAWVRSPDLRPGYRRVDEACRGLRFSGLPPGTVFRLSRFDRTPLLTAVLGKRGWKVMPWKA